MTHRQIETITFGTCLVICAPAHTHTHTHTHTHVHTHFEIGTGTVGPPSLQTLVRGGLFFFCHTFFQQGGSELPWGGGGCPHDCGSVFFSLFHMCILSIKYEPVSSMNQFQILTNFKLQVCHAMLCSVVVCCGLVRCKVVSCGVVWRDVL